MSGSETNTIATTRFKEWRKYFELTQQTLASRVGISAISG